MSTQGLRHCSWPQFLQSTGRRMSCKWGCLCPVGHSCNIASEHICIVCKLLLRSEGCMSFSGCTVRKLEVCILLLRVSQPDISPHITGGLLYKSFSWSLHFWGPWTQDLALSAGQMVPFQQGCVSRACASSWVTHHHHLNWCLAVSCIIFDLLRWCQEKVSSSLEDIRLTLTFSSMKQWILFIFLMWAPLKRRTNVATSVSVGCMGRFGGPSSSDGAFCLHLTWISKEAGL